MPLMNSRRTANVNSALTEPDVNLGTPSSIEPDPAYSYAGIGKLGGKNMIQTAGTYVVIFNDITGNYYFIKK